MAVFFTIFSWLLIFWLDSTVGFRLRLKLPSKSDPKAVMLTAMELIRKVGGKISSAQEYEHKRQVIIVGKMPSSANPVKFQASLMHRLPREEDIDIDLKTG
jgi:hypothetical protein